MKPLQITRLLQGEYMNLYHQFIKHFMLVTVYYQRKHNLMQHAFTTKYQHMNKTIKICKIRDVSSVIYGTGPGSNLYKSVY